MVCENVPTKKLCNITSSGTVMSTSVCHWSTSVKMPCSSQPLRITKISGQKQSLKKYTPAAAGLLLVAEQTSAGCKNCWLLKFYCSAQLYTLLCCRAARVVMCKIHPQGGSVFALRLYFFYLFIFFLAQCIFSHVDCND